MRVDKAVGTERPKKRRKVGSAEQSSSPLDRHGRPAEVIDVDALNDNESLPGPFPPPSFTLAYEAKRGDSVFSQVYWDTTASLGDVIDSIRDEPPLVPTQRANVAELTSRQGSNVTLVRSEGSGSSTSTLGKRTTAEFIYPTGELRNKTLRVRNIRPKVTEDPENPFCDVPAKPLPENLGKPVIITHSQFHWNLFDKRQLSTGVQWEFARLLTTDALNYKDILVEDLDKLKGSNSEAAPNVCIVVSPDRNLKDPTQFEKAIEKERASKSPWQELDREEAALKAGPYNALGCGDDGYYGGKVHFIGKLKEGKTGFTIILGRAELGPSTRFMRRFGSAAFIKIAVPVRLYNSGGERLIKFFSRPFVLNNRVFWACFAIDKNVYLKKTNDRVVGDNVLPPAHPGDLVDGQGSLLDFLNWHNPLECNTHQTMAKWVARIRLGFSNSVPGIMVQLECITCIPDKASDAFNGEGKLPSELDMTDGCGLMNAAGLRLLQGKFDWDTFPAAVQMRLGGTKGLLALDEMGKYEDTRTEPHVCIRPSQTKIKYHGNVSSNDPTFRIIDVIRPPKMRFPATLSHEIIINLSENGVDREVFKGLMKSGLDELVKSLTSWDIPNAMENLWINVARAGGVIYARMARELGGESRAMGYGDKDDDDRYGDNDNDDDEGLDAAFLEHAKAWWCDQVSGCPSSLEECVMVLLDSGFHPSTCAVLAEKLKQVVKKAIENYVVRYKIGVPMSCEALVIPDPYEVLEPGQVHIKCSRVMLGADGFETDTIRGDVLVTRHPCKLPSDVQKVIAVEHNALRHYTDVIVFSVKGNRSLASMLGGGDYDGDRVRAIWQPEIVNKFKNADSSFADPPPELQDAFIKETETVAQFLVRAPAGSTEMHLYELQKYLLGGLRNNSAVGIYSMLHDKCVYMNGYFHPESKRLAHMFCTILDGSKTGLAVKSDVLRADSRKYMGRKPLWRETAEDRERHMKCQSNEVHVKRGSTLHKFIMDDIKEDGQRRLLAHLSDYDKKVQSSGITFDNDLAAPWKKIQRWAEKVGPEALEDLRKIKEHVETVRATHRKTVLVSPRKGSPRKKEGGSFSESSPEQRQDALREISRQFAEGPSGLAIIDNDITDIAKLKASYAYIHDHDESGFKKWTRFPWDVAMRQLGQIKAESLGPSKTVTTGFYEKMTMCSLVRPR